MNAFVSHSWMLQIAWGMFNSCLCNGFSVFPWAAKAEIRTRVTLSPWLHCFTECCPQLHPFLYLDKKLVYAGCPSVRSKNLETIKGLVLNVWSRSKKVLHPAIISFSPTCYWNARPTYNYQKDQCMSLVCLGLSIHVTGPLQHRSLTALKRHSTHQDISCRTSKDPKLWMAGQFIAGRNQPSW